MQRIPIFIKFYSKVILLSIAFTFLVYQSWGELGFIGIIPVFLALGYLLGKLTCSKHLHGYGFLITIALFCTFNGFHSMIDGLSLSGFTFQQFIFVIIPHELVRQPMLYAIIWGMLLPFPKPLWTKIVVAIIAVTGTWVLGVILGTLAGHAVNSISWLHPYLAGSIFLLGGDMLHHLLDEYRVDRTKSCMQHSCSFL
jgi:hypothetical protein